MNVTGEMAKLNKGDQFKPLEFEMTPEIAGYTALAVGDRHPWLKEKSHFGERMAPGVDLQFCSQRQIVNHYTGEMSGAAFGTPAVLFVEFNAEYREPILVGDRVRVEGGCSDRFIKRGRSYITLSHDIYKGDGKLAAKYKSIYVIGYKKVEE